MLGEDEAKCIRRRRVVHEKVGIEEVEFVDVVKWKLTANDIAVDVDPILVVEVFGGAVVWETKVSNNHTYMGRSHRVLSRVLKVADASALGDGTL